MTCTCHDPLVFGCYCRLPRGNMPLREAVQRTQALQNILQTLRTSMEDLEITWKLAYPPPDRNFPVHDRPRSPR
jgi:hypothetical protein